MKSVFIASVVIMLLLLPLTVWLLYPVYNNKFEAKIENHMIMEVGSSVRQDPVDLSVVIPAYNEEKRMGVMLDSTIAFLDRWSGERQLAYEIIVVDDSSTDGTLKLASDYQKRLPDGKFRIVSLNMNQGKGGAVKIGVNFSLGKYILMADADGATDISDLNKLYHSLKSIEKQHQSLGTVGMAIGSRAHLENESIAKRAFYRTVLMIGFHMMVVCFCTKNIKDTQCGFKLFTKSTANYLFGNLHLHRWAFDIELIYLAELAGIPITESAVTWREIEGSKLIRSKLDVVTTSLSMARDIICVRLAYLLRLWQPKDLNKNQYVYSNKEL